MCVDPDRRCAVMLIYGTHIVVLPFRQEGVLDEHEQEGAFTARYDVCVYLQAVIQINQYCCKHHFRGMWSIEAKNQVALPLGQNFKYFFQS